MFVFSFCLCACVCVRASFLAFVSCLPCLWFACFGSFKAACLSKIRAPPEKASIFSNPFHIIIKMFLPNSFVINGTRNIFNMHPHCPIVSKNHLQRLCLKLCWVSWSFRLIISRFSCDFNESCRDCTFCHAASASCRAFSCHFSLSASKQTPKNRSIHCRCDHLGNASPRACSSRIISLFDWMKPLFSSMLPQLYKQQTVRQAASNQRSKGKERREK